MGVLIPSSMEAKYVHDLALNTSNTDNLHGYTQL